MKGRSTAIPLVSVMLLGVLALCGLTAFGTYRWVHTQGIPFSIRHDDVSAQVTDKRTFQVDGALALDVNNRQGDITVNARPGTKEIVIEVTKSGWGSNDAEAKAAAEALSVDMHQEGSKIIADFNPTEPNQLTFGTYRSPRVSFNIQVPPEADVTLRTTAGDLSLTGITGKTVLECTFGRLTVRDVRGEQNITGRSASLDINHIEAGDQPVIIQSSFGDIQAQQIEAGKLTVENTNGSIQLSAVKTGAAMKVKSSFNSIQLTEVTSPDLDIVSENGAIVLTKTTIHGPLHAQTRFEKIDLSETQADQYILENQNGAILLDGAQGSLELSSTFGEIRVTRAENAVLKIKNENGKVSFSGSLDAKADQSIETTMEEIQLRLPASTAADLDVSTTNGTIESNLPVTLSGQLSDEKWTGKLNGGGPVLSIHNLNGSVKIEELK